MLGQLVLALVVVVIGHLHALEVEVQRLTGEQALAAAIPVVELDKGQLVQLRPHQLVLHGLLGPAGDVEGELVILVIELGKLALHPVVERFAGELGFQELLELLGLFDLRLQILVLQAGDLLADQRGDDLPADLHQLPRRQVALEHPLIGAAFIGSGLGRDAGILRGPAGQMVEYVRRRLHVAGQSGAAKDDHPT